MSKKNVGFNFPPDPQGEVGITNDWEGNISEPLVSVICHTYNQQSYIKDAINGFLMQETTFPFEIIIHDDCSTDGTKAIIQDYAARYPNIIRLLLQEENQVSKGIKPSSFTFPEAKGDYVALCEGDDFWVDKEKLSKQTSALNKNINLNLCVSSSFLLLAGKEPTIHTQHSKVDTILNNTSFIINDGGYVTTASLLLRRVVIENLPDWFYSKAPVGDYYLQMLSSYPHGAIYLKEPMSVYRRDSENNWSSTYLKNVYKIAELRARLLETNILCEKELNDKRLYSAFTKANFHNFRIYVEAQVELHSGISVFRLLIPFFRQLQLRFLPYYFKCKWNGKYP